MVSCLTYCFLLSVFCARSSLFVWKSFKSERRHAGRIWRYNCHKRLSMLLHPSSPDPPPTPDRLHAPPSCLHVPLDCLVTVCAWWLARARYGCFLGLSVPLSSCPSPDATVNITQPLSCVLSPVHLILSFVFLSFFLSLRRPFSPSIPSCRLFIRRVNNCLPTVVIAPPCQLEVWSKWQRAQFSLAYILQFPVSLVPVGEKIKWIPFLLQLCFVCCINFLSPPLICLFSIQIFQSLPQTFCPQYAVAGFISSGQVIERQGHGVNTGRSCLAWDNTNYQILCLSPANADFLQELVVFTPGLISLSEPADAFTRLI